MSIVENVIKKIESKRSRKDRKREEEVWDMENWLIGTGRVVSKERRKTHH